MIGVAMIVGFSFQGTELIGIAAGESENPEKNIPRAVRQVFWRILLFYVFAILIISLIIPYTDPSLLRNDVKDISVSPFTLVFQHAGLLSAAAIMNAVILTAVLSAGNSGMYASTRMLYTLACDGKAPRIFSKLSRGGVPRNALYATTVIAAVLPDLDVRQPDGLPVAAEHLRDDGLYRLAGDCHQPLSFPSRLRHAG
jgi:lysine-specific permease